VQEPAREYGGRSRTGFLKPLIFGSSPDIVATGSKANPALMGAGSAREREEMACEDSTRMRINLPPTHGQPAGVSAYLLVSREMPESLEEAHKDLTAYHLALTMWERHFDMLQARIAGMHSRIQGLEDRCERLTDDLAEMASQIPDAGDPEYPSQPLDLHLSGDIRETGLMDRHW
jgi:hypothetical protein